MQAFYLLCFKYETFWVGICGEAALNSNQNQTVNIGKAANHYKIR